jgi:hypothetical protein
MIPETGTLLIWFGGAALVFLGLVALLGTGRGQVTDRLASVSGESRRPGVPGGAAGLLQRRQPDWTGKRGGDCSRRRRSGGCASG